MNPAALTRLVEAKAAALGFDLAGIVPAGPSPDTERFQRWLAAGHDADMAYLARRAAERADPRRIMPGARSIIVLGANYFSENLPASLRNDPSRGLIASYAWGDDYHDVLKPLLFELDAAIRAASGRMTRGRAFVDTGPLLERSWAQRAGLGFSGKNTCLIAPKQGSWLFLAVLLVPEEIQNAEFRMQNPESGERQFPDGAQQTSRDTPDSAFRTPARAPERSTGASVPHSAFTCASCTRCLDICPTNAFPAPHVLDSRRCISYQTIEQRGPIPLDLRPRLGNWIFGCDLCQIVCPYNRRFARPTRIVAFQPRPDIAAPRLLDLLALDQAAFSRRFRRSPVKRAKRRGLLRNVCVALGNWGDPVAVPGLIDALHDPEPLIRGHAAWALGRIATPAARQALIAQLDREADATVQKEIKVALSEPERSYPL